MKTGYVLEYARVKAAVEAMIAEIEQILPGQAAVVCVADSHGEPIALARMDGVQLAAQTICTNKAYTAARAARPTAEIGARVKEAGFSIAYYGDVRFTGFGGGIPIKRDGQVVGAVGVSGMASEDDIRIAQLGVTMLQG